MTERERVEYLLETFLDAREVMGKSESVGRGGEGHIPLMSELWNSGSYRKLEKLLGQLKLERPTQYHHLSKRYFQAHDKVIEVKTTRQDGQVRPILPEFTALRGTPAIMPGGTARIAVRTYQRSVRLDQVKHAVDWLTSKLAASGGVWLPKLLAA